MWGFPLVIKKIKYKQHTVKKPYKTMDEALAAARRNKLPTIYKCGWCPHYHLSSHTWQHMYGNGRILLENNRKRA